MPFRYPLDPAEREREMWREDRFILLMTILCGAGVILAVVGMVASSL